MKLYFQNPPLSHYNNSIRFSSANKDSARYCQEKDIQNISEQNTVYNYFQFFDKNHTEVEIKNFISKHLQPSYQLPNIHDNNKLLSKAEDLLGFSLSI